MELSQYSQGGGRYSSLSGYRHGPWGRGSYATVGRAGQTIGRALKNWWSAAGRRNSAPVGSKRQRDGGPVRKRSGGAKSKIAQGGVMNEGTGGQYSMFVHNCGKSYLPAHIENALAPQVVQANLSSQLKSTVGRQIAVDAMQLFSPALVTTFTGDKISRVLYAKASADLTLNNIYLSNAYVIIYDVIARRDAASGVVATPYQAWSQGATDESASNSPTYLGSTPWQSEAFNQFWEVKQVTNVVLCAGGTHVHKVRMTENKVISAARGQYNNGMLGGVTYWTMIEVHGSPANDTTTQTQVSVGVAGLNIIADQEQTLKLLQKQTPTITNTNTLLTAFTVAEQVVNLGGSTIVPQAEG